MKRGHNPVLLHLGGTGSRAAEDPLGEPTVGLRRLAGGRPGEGILGLICHRGIEFPIAAEV
jgi:hypothetical protein